MRKFTDPPRLPPPFSTMAWNSQIDTAHSNAHRISAVKTIESFTDKIAYSLPLRVFESNITFIDFRY